MKHGHNISIKLILPVLLLGVALSSNLYAGENTSFNDMPAPPAGPYRSTKYFTTRQPEIPSPVVGMQHWVAPMPNMPEPVSGQKPDVKPESKVVQAAPDTPIGQSLPQTKSNTEDGAVTQKFWPPMLSQPGVANVHPQYSPGYFSRYNRAFNNLSGRPFNSRRWMPPPPPQWSRPPRQFMPQYPVPPMRQPVPPRQVFNNRNLAPPPPWGQPGYPTVRNFSRPPVWQKQVPAPYRRW